MDKVVDKWRNLCVDLCGCERVDDVEKCTWPRVKIGLKNQVKTIPRPEISQNLLILGIFHILRKNEILTGSPVAIVGGG